MKREDFFKQAGRWTILAFIAGIVTVITGRREVTFGASCPEGDLCRECKNFDSCDLPQAKEQR